METERKRGGQPGNQNARKHGFYSCVLDELEKHDLEEALLLDGIDEEIAILRVKLKSVLRHCPRNTTLITHAALSLARAVQIKDRFKPDKQGLKEAFSNVIRDFAIPVGIDIGKFILKRDQ